jgi:ABC-type sugar transport system permease subunit
MRTPGNFARRSQRHGRTTKSPALPVEAGQNATWLTRFLFAVLLVTLILQIIGTAQVFLEPFLFTSGGPVNSTLTVLLLIYDYAFGNSLGGDYGAATALSLMLAVFLALFSFVYLRATRSWSNT